MLPGSLALALAVFTAAAIGVLSQALPRSFTPAQQQQIVNWQMGGRWRQWPAGKIFPADVSYRLPGSLVQSSSGLSLRARRIGIAGQTTCLKAVDDQAARALMREGCQAVLRATYLDATQSLLVTVGVVVMPSPGSARAGQGAFPRGDGPLPGVRPVKFPRTLAARFSDSDRQVAWHMLAGPYLVLATVGYVDGRRHVPESSDPYMRGEMLSLASGVGEAVADGIGAQPAPPRCPGAPAC